MKTKFLITLAFLFIAGLLLAAAFNQPQSNKKPNEAYIFAAASLKDLVEDLGKAYGGNGKRIFYYNFAATNMLAQQIVRSSKPDIFISANEQWMDFVETEGKILPNTRKPLLSNTLVVIANQDERFKNLEKADICRLKTTNFALADPDAVPAGKYAKTWMQSVECNGQSLWGRMESKIIPTLDVRAALHLVETQKDMLGIVYKTDVKQSDKVKTLYEISIAEGPQIRYSVAKLKKQQENLSAQEFLNFLESSQARAIFERHGFIPL